MPNETTGERLLARRYRLVTPVGRGGMGTVWHAHDEVLGRDVAVKEVILPHGLTDEERAVQHKRTFREARTAARLGHPGVVTVYDVVEEDDRPWIIMELLRAPSLDQIIKTEGPLEPRRAAELGRQMLAALHAAHEAGVLHRDVKPSNVLVSRGDRAVLTDFGIATAAGDATLTQTGLVMGSPAYIAPERARGRTAGPASDLWSLGVTLYAMLHGKSPFERSEPMAALVAVISEDPDPPENAGPLRPVIEGLLRKNPDQRMDAIEAGALLDDIVRMDTVDTQRTMAVEMPLEELLGRPADRTSEPAGGDAADTAADATSADAYAGLYADEPGGGAPVGAGAAESGGPSSGLDTQPHRWDDEDAARPPGGRLGEAPGATRVSAAANEMGADAAPVGPGTRPVGGQPPTAPARRPPALGGGIMIAIVIVVIVLVAVAGYALARAGKDDNEGATRGATQPAASFTAQVRSAPATSSAASSSPPATPSTDSRVPAGFRLYRGNNFSTAIPEDWKGPERRDSSPSSVFFTPPSGEGYIQIDQTSDPNESALEDWQNLAPSVRDRFPGYDEIKIAPVKDGEPVSDPSGDKAADWEWTYKGKSGRLHALNRGFVMGGFGFAILLVAPEDTWDDTFAKLAPVYEEFEADDD
ncbi:serine/threonine-protein kinase [Actinomadura sp. NBRC 104425]|uniref:serine/threonine-protein kinase n=1 Tax=Actinomadura sp. NBRC 104425 TaxID=3032204 RepID=UPI002552BA23|nr:serine/threonine-protein kinase [Actinomadura sp. NBRC 104425]